MNDSVWLGWDDNKITYCHHLLSDHKDEEEDAFKRHLLLELLATLGFIEYERGYDGHYYDIYLKIRS